MNRLAVLAVIGVVAGANAQVITQSATQNIVSGNSVSCNNQVAHTDNWYARGFVLSEHSIAGPWAVSQVEFAVEEARSVNSTLPVEVRLYDGFTVSGSVLTMGSLMGTFATNVPVGSAYFHQVAVSGTVNSGLLGVEIFTPDGTTNSDLMWIGSNPDGQTHASYLRADDCGITSLTDIAAIGFPGMHIVMNVTGAPVPEPASMLALATGAIALIRRRRSSK
ncbi:MAG: PEP-CTERM sorting domain-containing protein [Fimbriimonadaceae bacterium]|nr:PEP-CTERM sorting domain-containing protein [Chthonomonadaceae bacterium]MCO5298076.1 PEP-CTERM sorting domain-containing protein [Fimbriimonadaceae bacterium]